MNPTSLSVFKWFVNYHCWTDHWI